MIKKLEFLTVVLLSTAIIITGCVQETGSENPPSSNTTSVVSNTASSAGTTAPTEEKKAAPDKIKVFYITSGSTVPDNFDYKNNFVIDEIARLANVEIEEAVVPPYSDYMTKFNLMMSSGDICDVVHIPSPNQMTVHGKNGAFIELTEIIKNSPVLSSRYTPMLIELLKANDGKIYTLRSLPVDGDVSNSFAVRYDLLEQVGIAGIPDTMEGWLDAMRKVKAKFPDSIPYTSTETLMWIEFPFRSFGCAANGYNWQYYNGKVIHTFENPLFKDAVNFYRTMLSEGLMDKEFVTSKSQDFQDKRLNKKVLICQQNLAAMTSWIDRFTKNNITDAMFIPAQWPKISDSRIDPSSVYDGMPSLGSACVSISSTSKQKDAAVRFVEALLSDECYELSIWGREGTEFNIVSGIKTPDYEKSNLTNWRTMYNMLFGFNTMEKLTLSVKTNVASSKFEDAGKVKYEKLFMEQAEKLLADNAKVAINPMPYVTLETDTVSRINEAVAAARSITIKTIVGEMSFEEFDIKAAEFIKKYQSITDEFNQKLPDAKKKVGLN